MQTSAIERAQFQQTMNLLSREEQEDLDDKMGTFEAEFSKPSQAMNHIIKNADTKEEGLRAVLLKFQHFVE